METARVKLTSVGIKHRNEWVADLLRNKYVYLMAIPMVLYYVIFHYVPIYGIMIAFKEYKPSVGFIDSPWVGFEHFIDYVKGVYFFRTMRNTLLLNIYSLFWSFPVPIILALLINEMRKQFYKRLVQTMTYLPHFISIVVVASFIKEFTSVNGAINDMLAILGFERNNLLMDPGNFRTIYIFSGIWQEAGWGSIIYLAALSAIDPEQYDSAVLDGAGRWAKMRYITLPGILPTIVILLILRMGQLFNVGFEKIILLYSESIYETADVISTYVFRMGLVSFSWSYSTAVNLFNSILNFAMLILANYLSKKVNETSLW